MNFFSVLDDSDEEKPKVIPPKKDAAPKAAAPAAKASAPVKKDAAPKTAKPAGDAKPRAAAPAAADGEVSKDNNRGGKPRGKDTPGGGRGGRGEGRRDGEAGEGRPPKREYERRSGTGRGNEVSRGGRGPFGAGNPAQEAQDAEKDPKSAEIEVEGEVTEVSEPVEVAEPEPETFTMDDFMKKREEARAKVLSLVGTKARIVSKDTEALGSMVNVEKSELGDYLSPAAIKAEVGRTNQRSSGKQQVLTVGFKSSALQTAERDGGGGGKARAAAEATVRVAAEAGAVAGTTAPGKTAPPGRTVPGPPERMGAGGAERAAVGVARAGAEAVVRAVVPDPVPRRVGVAAVPPSPTPTSPPWPEQRLALTA
eukprot:CAMPEP_0173184400 /NCGR_PEP_ID=MMETSP1141-20130122/8950_1 /TAXON_ID=483371 /ORGANISM="non described non described, Strain CCMP2298" /LENGTH=366 /DNA_ID=CAMNT_0014107757 /DNA_START=56 /DNA_END=1157 /DNA_ORIENTATION=+